jgi:hypothetical protein
VGEKWPGKFSLKMPDFHIAFRDLLLAVNLRHGTHSFTSLPEGRRAEDFFFRPEKSDGFGAGLNLVGLKASTLPLDHRSRLGRFFCVSFQYTFLALTRVSVCLSQSVRPQGTTRLHTGRILMKFCI